MDNDYNSFVLYHDFKDNIDMLETLEQKGLLFEAIFNYQMGNDYLTDDKFVNFIMLNLIKTFERDKQKWLNIKQKRRDAANKRWNKEPPKTKIVERVEIF